MDKIDSIQRYERQYQQHKSYCYYCHVLNCKNIGLRHKTINWFKKKLTAEEKQSLLNKNALVGVDPGETDFINLISEWPKHKMIIH